jgi:hypothetical protein
MDSFIAVNPRAMYASAAAKRSSSVLPGTPEA